MMEGMTLKSLKKHKALLPLYACTFLGVGGAIFYTLRLATRNPDVAWTNKSSGTAESNAYYANRQYKFYSPTVDYSKVESPAPKY